MTCSGYDNPPKKESRKSAGEARLGNKRQSFHPSGSEASQRQGFDRLRRLRETDKRRAAGIAMRHRGALIEAGEAELRQLIDAGFPDVELQEVRDRQDKKLKALPSAKMGLCGYTQIKGKPTQQFMTMKDREKGAAPEAHSFISGVQKCGLGFLCPDCGYRKMETMRTVLNKGIAVARHDGLRLVMMTLTTRHKPEESAADVYDRVATAFQRTKRLKAWTRLMKRAFGFAWVIEWTWSPRTGFHPHFHVLIAMRSSSEEKAIEEVYEVRPAFMGQLAAAGGDGTSEAAWERSFHVAGAEAVGHYMSKWGSAEELTKGGVKGGGGFPPTALLRRSWTDPDAECRAEAAEIWWEIACVMKGKAQVFASEGWKLLEGRFEELFPQEVEPDVQPALVQDFGTRESGQEPTEKWMWARDRRLALVEAAEAEAPGGLPGIGQRVNARAVLAQTDAEIVAAEMRNAQDDPGPLVEDDEQSSPGSAGGEPVDDGGDDVKDRGDEIGAVKHGRVSEADYPRIVGDGSCHSHAHGSGPSSEWSDGGYMLSCDMAMTTPSSTISRMSGGSSPGS